MKYLLTSIFLFLFVNNGLAQLATFNMGDTSATNLCEGILFDSGGPDGNYQVEEDHVFTICPTANTKCISMEVINYDIENPFDFLKIYEGEGIEGNLLKSINKKGVNNLVYAKNECVTIQFISDKSQERAGFELSWKCLAECPEFEDLTIENPHIIDAIPFQAANLSTCFAGNNLETGPCTDDRFLLGDEYVFAYNSEGGECITVNIEGIINETGISIFRGLPNANNVKCISQKEVDEGNQMVLPNVPLKEKGTYYFVVANEFNCTPFDISITASDNCPTTFPSAANCEDALILNGCSPDLPVALTVEQDEGANDFFQIGVNNGCWEDVFETNYTWFAFEAQGDGEFAFLLSNNDPNGVVDIDFNIWGPYDKLETACSETKKSQPIRSSWADDMLYSETGLTSTNPEFGTPITDTCESLEGDGFLKPLTVKKGEVFVVLINDYDGVIFDGAILIDFKGSDPNVLANLEEDGQATRDTFICEGESLQLTAPTAAFYEWSATESLSCLTCVNPIANPSTTTTYSVKASNVCNAFINEIEVEVIPEIPSYTILEDQQICVGEIVNLGAYVTTNLSYEWTASNNFSSNETNPVVSPLDSTTYFLTIEETVCSAEIKDTVTITVANFSLKELGDGCNFIGQKNDSIILQTNVSDLTIEWRENGLIIPGENDTVLSYIPLANEPVSMEVREVVIEVTATTTSGCIYKEETTIQVKPPLVPNVFTPGNDGRNDYFNLMAGETEEIIDVFKVYNRWGKLVYDNDDAEKGWNGNLRNAAGEKERQPAGVYVYIIQYMIDERVETVKGNVTLLR